MPNGILGEKRPFQTPAQQAEIQRQHNQEVARAQANKPDPEAEGIDKAAAALNGAASAAATDSDIKKMEAFSKEDMDLAEQLLFRGYAEKNYKVVGTTITVTTMSSAESELINEMVYEYANDVPAPDPKKPLEPVPGKSAKVVEGQQTMLTNALTFKGIGDKDISPAAGRSLSFLKAGVKRMSDAEIAGDVKIFNDVRADLKKAIWARASELKRVSTPLIDTISKRRYEFEKLMYDITSRDDLLPKS